ncbi:hypothetical protein DFQ28_004146, partial [Apophysomyces sp. BC1034]
NKKEEENILKKRFQQQQIPKTVLNDACMFTDSSENPISKESLRYGLKGCNLSKYWQTYVKGYFDALYKEIVDCLQEKGTEDEDSEDDDEKNFWQKTVAKIDKYKLYKGRISRKMKELSKKLNKSDIDEDEISDCLQGLKNLQEHWFHFEGDIQSSSPASINRHDYEFLIEDLQLKGLSDEQVVDILEEPEELDIQAIDYQKKNKSKKQAKTKKKISKPRPVKSLCEDYTEDIDMSELIKASQEKNGKQLVCLEERIMASVSCRKR